MRWHDMTSNKSEIHNSSQLPLFLLAGRIYKELSPLSLSSRTQSVRGRQCSSVWYFSSLSPSPSPLSSASTKLRGWRGSLESSTWSGSPIQSATLTEIEWVKQINLKYFHHKEIKVFASRAKSARTCRVKGWEVAPVGSGPAASSSITGTTRTRRRCWPRRSATLRTPPVQLDLWAGTSRSRLPMRELFV